MNIFGIGLPELLLIGVIAMIVFGPEKLPEIMGQVGRAVAEFRKITGELSSEFNRTIQSEIDQTRAVVDSTRAVVEGAAAPKRTVVPPAPAPEPIPVGVAAAATANGSSATATQPAADVAPSPSWAWETASQTATSATHDEQRPRRDRSTSTDDLLPPY